MDLTIEGYDIRKIYVKHWIESLPTTKTINISSKSHFLKQPFLIKSPILPPSIQSTKSRFPVEIRFAGIERSEARIHRMDSHRVSTISIVVARLNYRSIRYLTRVTRSTLSGET